MVWCTTHSLLIEKCENDNMQNVSVPRAFAVAMAFPFLVALFLFKRAFKYISKTLG